MSFCLKLKFQICSYLEPDGVKLWLFNPWLFVLTEIIVWKIKDLRHWFVIYRARDYKIRVCVQKSQFILLSLSLKGTFVNLTWTLRLKSIKKFLNYGRAKKCLMSTLIIRINSKNHERISAEKNSSIEYSCHNFFF